MIIGISGKKQSGKNLVANIITVLTSDYDANSLWFNSLLKSGLKVHLPDSPWVQKSFAGKVKEVLSILTGIPVEDMEKEEVKNSYLGEEWGRIEGYNLETKSWDLLDKVVSDMKYISFDRFESYTVRELLQKVGTDAMRDVIHPDCWTIALFKDYIGDIEVWKDIKEYKGKYQISNFGRIKGLDRRIVYGDESKGEYHTKKEAILKSTVSGKYKMIKLEGNNSVLIHKLVAEYFLPIVKDKPYINHIDQNPINNFYKNLEWCTQSENVLSANLAGNGNVGVKQKDSKLTDEKVKEIRQLLELGILKQKEIALMYNVGTATISDIRLNKKWKYVDNIYPVSPILPVAPPNWIISDVRFRNEAKAIKDRSGIIIRINRSSLESKDQHESETALDNYQGFNYVIENTSTIEDLVLKVSEILKQLKII